MCAYIGWVANQVIESACIKIGLFYTMWIERISAIDVKLWYTLAYMPMLVKQKWQALYKQIYGCQVTGKGIQVETHDGAGQDVQCIPSDDLISSDKVL